MIFNLKYKSSPPPGKQIIEHYKKNRKIAKDTLKNVFQNCTVPWIVNVEIIMADVSNMCYVVKELS